MEHYFTIQLEDAIIVDIQVLHAQTARTLAWRISPIWRMST
jgi:type VI protein secretion system component Hcp